MGERLFAAPLLSAAALGRLAPLFARARSPSRPVSRHPRSLRRWSPWIQSALRCATAVRATPPISTRSSGALERPRREVISISTWGPHRAFVGAGLARGYVRLVGHGGPDRGIAQNGRGRQPRGGDAVARGDRHVIAVEMTCFEEISIRTAGAARIYDAGCVKAAPRMPLRRRREPMRWFHAVEGEDGGKGGAAQEESRQKKSKSMIDKDAEVSVRVLILNG